MMRIRECILLSILSLSAFSAHADNKAFYDRVNLSAEAVEEVKNDMLVVIMYSQHEGTNLEQAADKVNRAIENGISQARRIRGLDIQTLSYQTHPVYRNKTISGWRVKQSVQFRGRKITEISKLMGSLQRSLAVASVRYDISPKMRVLADERLIEKAISAFRKRALDISRHLGRTKYRLVNMDVRTGATAVPPIHLRTERMAISSKVAAPRFEPGTQKLKVHVSGVIELVVE